MSIARQHAPRLYRSSFEKDNCGFGLIAHMDGQPSHWLIKTAIDALARLTHRGAVAADGKTGDGCGLLMKKPDTFLRGIANESDIALAANYAAGNIFLHLDAEKAARARDVLAAELQAQGLRTAGWRALPIDPAACGAEALRSLPRIEQLFVNAPDEVDEPTFARRLYVARRRTEKRLEPDDDV